MGNVDRNYFEKELDKLQQIEEQERSKGLFGKILSDLGDFNEAMIMEGKLGRYLGPLIPIIITVPLWAPAIYLMERDNQRENLKYEVSVLADKDMDGITSQNEWADVYRSVGMQYNSDNTKDLTLNQLRQYLDQNL